MNTIEKLKTEIEVLQRSNIDLQCTFNPFAKEYYKGYLCALSYVKSRLKDITDAIQERDQKIDELKEQIELLKKLP